MLKIMSKKIFNNFTLKFFVYLNPWFCSVPLETGCFLCSLIESFKVVFPAYTCDCSIYGPAHLLSAEIF